MNRVKQSKDTRSHFKPEKQTFSKATGSGLRAAGTLVLLLISPQVLSQFDAVVELSDLDGNSGFVINGIDSGDRSGVSVSSAGDINGDGVADLIIGASRADPNGDDTGESYVVFGGIGFGSGGTFELSNLDGSNGFVINGIDMDDSSGGSVSSAGDFNGDGLADLIIGARRADPDGVAFAGESYVVFGGANVSSGRTFELSNLDGNNGFVINGIDASDSSGRSVSSAGDFNGDGLDDLIIGATSNIVDGAGESYVVFGDTDVGSAGSLELSDLDGSNGFVINGIAVGDFAGISVSNAGDFNGDGAADLVIGANLAVPNGSAEAGETYVVFGGASVGSGGSFELSDLDGSNGFMVNGFRILQRTGSSVSGAGDINGDGTADIIIGAFSADPNGKSDAGQSFVLFGGPRCNGLLVTVDLNFGETAGPGADVVLGTPNADNINTFGGDDTICGEGGRDIINAGGGNDWVDGGRGHDDIQGSAGDDIIIGSFGDDVIRGGSGDDEIDGEEGDDTLLGQAGDDVIYGGDGVDEINGGSGKDIIFTGSGATVSSGVTVSGGGGDDTINGGPDADDLIGSSGADTINGEGGDDEITGGTGRDEINGGDGDDDIRGQDSRDTINGGAGNDDINGGSGNDTINGGDGDDELNGGPGDDVVRGDSGSDMVIGGSGADTLTGGPSSGDICNGQSEIDTAAASCESTVNVP